MGAIINGKYVKDAKPEEREQSDRYKEYTRDRQREDHRRDIIQPYLRGTNKPNPEFVHAYPNRAREYFSEADLRDM